MSETAMRTEWMEFRTDGASVFVGKDVGNTTEMRFRLLLGKKEAGGPADVSWLMNGHAVREVATRWFPDPAPRPPRES